MSDGSRIAHPDWLDDACGQLARTLHLDSTLPNGLPQRGWMLSVPAHRMLRAIHGSSWAVAWWAVRKALADSVSAVLPQWWHRLAYRVKYGEDPEAVLREFEADQ